MNAVLRAVRKLFERHITHATSVQADDPGMDMERLKHEIISRYIKTAARREKLSKSLIQPLIFRC